MSKFGKALLWAAVAALLPLDAFAQDAGAAQGAGLWGVGAGLAMGLGALGCGIGQGLTAGNTTAGIARNPGASGTIFTPFILGMALIESLALFSFVVAFLLYGKV